MDWLNGKLSRTPQRNETRSWYKGVISLKGRRICRFFSWKKCSESEAYENCRQWILDTSIKHDLLRNRYRYINETQMEVQLNTSEKREYAIVDRVDLPLVEKYTWHAARNGQTSYMRTFVRDSDRMRHHFFFHKLLKPELQQIDHIDGNGLNNSRGNLRDGSNGVNQNNRSLIKTNRSTENGISRHSNDRGWRVSWKVKKQCPSKYFSYSKYGSEEDAFRAAKRFRDEKYAEIGNGNGKRRRM